MHRTDCAARRCVAVAQRRNPGHIRVLRSSPVSGAFMARGGCRRTTIQSLVNISIADQMLTAVDYQGAYRQ